MNENPQDPAEEKKKKESLGISGFEYSHESTEKTIHEISKFHSGSYFPLKTRFQHLNKNAHGGITIQKNWAIGALSSFGKSHVIRQIEEDIFNEELNPGSKENVILIKCDFEITKTEYFMAKVHERTGVDYETLLYSKPEGDVKKAFNDVYKELDVDYIIETFNTYKPDNFYKDIQPVLTKYAHKKQIVVTIDNLNLLEDDPTEAATMSKFMRHLIQIKKDFKNVSVIALAQLNRELKLRSEPRGHFPMTTDFAHSSKIEHAVDLQLVLHNPYLLGILEYGAVKPERYSHLSKYLIEDTKKKYSYFRTKGLMFWHYVKVRMKNNLKDFQDVHVEEIFKVEADDYELKPGDPFKDVVEPVFKSDKPSALTPNVSDFEIEDPFNK